MEIERKFASVSPGGFEALLHDKTLAPYLRGQTSVQMGTTYYDVSGNALGHAGFMLRLRREGDKTICCLKGPAGPDGARLELEAEADAIQDGLAAVMAMPGFPPTAAAILHRQTPVARCAAVFTRVSALYDDGALVFILCRDIGRAEGGGKTSPIDEIELEYQTGDLARFEALCDMLATRHGLQESHITKAKRAFALLEE